MQKKLLYGLGAAVFVAAVLIVISATGKSTGQSQSNILSTYGTPFNASELSIINNEPLNNYEIAGERLLNGSLTDPVFISPSGGLQKINGFVANGKPSVVYIGATTCPFCAENRWAMALALAKFGQFNALYKGYSSVDEYGGLTTLYFGVPNATTQPGPEYGDFYSSNLINLISADYYSPTTGAVNIQPPSAFIDSAPNSTYSSAISLMDRANTFRGTPYSLWGNVIISGADAVVFGNTTPSASAQTVPLSKMTHDQVLAQLKGFDTQFAWSEYAAADVYIAYLCPSLNNTAQVCNLPAIKSIELQAGLRY